MSAGDAPVVIQDGGGSQAEVHLKPGQILQVRLGSNRTAGYRWQVVPDGDGCLVAAGQRYEPFVAGPPQGASPQGSSVAGAGGTDVFTFATAHEGSVVLHFAMRRGQGDPASRSFVVAVTVAAATLT